MTARCWSWSALVALVGVMLVGLVSAGVPSHALAGPPPMDPRGMSGIPRPDPQIPAGTITVRVLKGSFDNPALEQPVTLKLTDAKGTKTETLTVKTLNQGRATFEGLLPWVGGRAIASVDLDGEAVVSAPIDITGDIGVAVMLVSGGDAVPERPAAPSRTPMPGSVFEFDKVDPGQLMVGAFDLSTKRAAVGVTITLHVVPTEGEETTQTQTTDAEGKVVFGGLDALPPGTKLMAEGQLGPQEPVLRSETFEPLSGKGMAVVLAQGRLPEPSPDPHAQAEQRARVPGPRVVPSLPQGTVRVRLVDGRDRPVAEQDVVVVMRDASQTEVKFPGTTDALGVAMLGNVDVRSDAFYYVRTVYDQGPYRSGFFQLDKQGGVAVDLRVFETTADPTVVKAALQYEIRGTENDMAQVYRIFEVLVQGDKAYWVPGGMQLDAPEGAKSVTVLRPAEPWLDHEGKAPFATLSRPIPPGEPVHLSLAWVAEHSGEIEVDWTPPFTLLQLGVILSKKQTLDAVGAEPSEREPPDPEVALWELPPQTVPVHFAVEGLPVRDPTFRYAGIAIGSLLALLAIGTIVMTPNRSAKQRLLAQRDELVALLGSTAGAGVRRERILAALDRIYRQLDALDAVGQRPVVPVVPAASKAASKSASKSASKAASKAAAESESDSSEDDDGVQG